MLILSMRGARSKFELHRADHGQYGRRRGSGRETWRWRSAVCDVASADIVILSS